MNKQVHRTEIRIAEGPMRRDRSFLKPFWWQGEFYFNEEKRVANFTDVHFISPSLLVIANREAAKLYLVELTQSGFHVIHDKTLRTTMLPSLKRYFHPDLIAISGSRVFITDFTNRVASFDILDNKEFKFNKLIRIRHHKYHGCFIENNELFLGSVRNGVVVSYNLDSGEINEFRFNSSLDPFHVGNLRIKALGKIGNRFILGMDLPKGGPATFNNGGDSWIGLFEVNGAELNCLSHLKYENTQLDGHASFNENHYFTLHDGTKKSGLITIVKIEDGQLRIVKNVSCEAFPHGIDVNHGKLAYTSYGRSSVIISGLEDFLGPETFL